MISFLFKPTKHPLRGWIIIGLIALCIAALHGCSLYPKLQNHPPLTNKDSTELSQSCVKTFPAKQNSSVSNSVTHSTIKKDSSNAIVFKNNIDTLFKEDTVNIYWSDSGECEDRIVKLKNNIENAALQDCPTWNELDTVFNTTTITVHSSEDSALIFNLQSNYAESSRQITIDNQTIKDRNQLLWIVGGGSVLSLLLLGLAVGKILKKNAG